MDRPLLAIAHAVALAAALGAAGCGKEDAPDGPAAGKAAAGSGPEMPEPPPPAPAEERRPVTPERLAEIAKTEIPGFARKGERVTATSAMPWYEALADVTPGWRIAAVVTFGPCVRCKPMDLPTWVAHESELRGVLPAAHRADPALVFDLFEIDLDGRPGIALHKRSFLSERGQDGVPAVSVVHGLTVWRNDGRHEVTIDLTLRGAEGAPAAASAADVEAHASRADLVRAAQTIYASFSPAF